MARKTKRPKAAKKQHAQQIPLYQINEIMDLWSQGLSNNAVAIRMDINRRTVDRLRLNIDLCNEPYPAFVKRGPRRKLNREQEDCMLDYLRDRPTAYRSEVQWFLFDEFEVVISEQRISEILGERHFSKKAAQRVAAEQNPLLRADYEEKMKSMPAHRICCVDESATNERTGWRKYGFSPLNTLCKDQGSAKRSKRISVLLAITIDGYLCDPLIYQGSITAEQFENWIEYVVVPQLNRGMFLVMDNAPIHRNSRLIEICDAASIELVKLPPYSPNYNPIELSFSYLKAWIKRNF